MSIRSIFIATGILAVAAAALAEEPLFDELGEESQAAAVPPGTGVEWVEPAYRAQCGPCHGTNGRGDGPAAAWLQPPPRDFTRGEYKWRSTPTGSLPLDSDLLRTIDEGAHGTAMPSWKDKLPERVRRGLVQYVKTFSPRFRDEEPEEPIAIPTPPEPTPEMIAEGAKVYERLKCWNCHGKEGRGDGPSAPTLKDSQGRPIDAYDFTKGFYKSGSSPETIYRTYMTGLNGTPMPSYEQTTTPEERWPLVFHTMSLHRERNASDYLFAPLEEQ